MILKLASFVIAIPLVLLASDNTSNLSSFPDAGKSLQQFARESVDRQIAASVQGKNKKDWSGSSILRSLPPQKLPQRARSEVCSIPLLESKIEHPERFSMRTLKLPPIHADNMAVPGPAPACQHWN